MHHHRYIFLLHAKAAPLESIVGPSSVLVLPTLSGFSKTDKSVKMVVVTCWEPFISNGDSDKKEGMIRM